MHLELGLEMIKQDALAQHLCCIFTRKCFLRLDTQVLAGLCAQRPHPPCMCGACARLSQHAQRVRRYWPFHILLWRVSPWARVSVISCQISYLFKSPLLHFGKERKWIERWFCPSEQWKHWSHGIYYQLPEHWAAWCRSGEWEHLSFGRMCGFTCLRPPSSHVTLSYVRSTGTVFCGSVAFSISDDFGLTSCCLMACPHLRGVSCFLPCLGTSWNLVWQCGLTWFLPVFETWHLYQWTSCRLSWSRVKVIMY